jgi:hypothetical protein
LTDIIGGTLGLEIHEAFAGPAAGTRCRKTASAQDSETVTTDRPAMFRTPILPSKFSFAAMQGLSIPLAPPLGDLSFTEPVVFGP